MTALRIVTAGWLYIVPIVWIHVAAIAVMLQLYLIGTVIAAPPPNSSVPGTSPPSNSSTLEFVEMLLRDYQVSIRSVVMDKYNRTPEVALPSKPLWLVSSEESQLQWRTVPVPNPINTLEEDPSSASIRLGTGSQSITQSSMLLFRRDNTSETAAKNAPIPPPVKPRTDFQQFDAWTVEDVLFMGPPLPSPLPSLLPTGSPPVPTVITGIGEIPSLELNEGGDPSDVTGNILDTNENDTPANSNTTTSATLNQVRVVTLTAAGPLFAPSVGSLATVRREMWVTLTPQIQQFCQDLVRQTPEILEPLSEIQTIGSLLSDYYPQLMENMTERDFGNPSKSSLLTLRLQQYLGLPPRLPSHRMYMVSFWVNPDDLFRPCLQPDVLRRRCDSTIVHWDWAGNLQLKASKPRPFNPWFYDRATSKDVYGANASEWRYAVPWTRIGYTYDWHDAEKGTFVGATELILRPNAVVHVDQVETMFDYCTPPSA